MVIVWSLYKLSLNQRLSFVRYHTDWNSIFTSKSIFRHLTNLSLKTQITTVLQERSICLHIHKDSDLKSSEKSEVMS